jgi:oxalate decarboxylase
MSDITRRGVLGAAAAAATGLLAQKVLGEAAAAEEADKKADKPAATHRFRLEASEERPYSGGSVKEATVNNFPISKEMSGVSLRLKPGGLREPHWHPNADEWSYCLAGKARMTVVSPKGMAETFDFAQGDTAYVPRGYGHNVQNVGDDDCRILIVFNTGDFEEIGVTGWLADTPKDVLAAAFHVPEKTFENFPKKELFITSKEKQ